MPRLAGMARAHARSTPQGREEFIDIQIESRILSHNEVMTDDRCGRLIGKPSGLTIYT